MTKQPLRVGVVNFLNAWPLWAALEKNKNITVVHGVPSALARSLHADEIDAALISSIEFFRQPNNYTYHPRLCIGAEREVRSIRLFMPKRKGDFAQALGACHTIYTDSASRSSVAQLAVLLRSMQLDIPLVEVSDADAKIPRLAEGEALIAIGDTALRHLSRPSFDVQAEYFRALGRGFVYAIWVYPLRLRAALEPLFDQAYAEYNADMGRYLTDAVARFGFPLEFTEDYLKHVIRHNLSEALADDMRFFAAQASALHKNY